MMDGKPTEIINLLKHWLARQLEAESWDWLDRKSQQIASDASERVLFTAFSTVSRQVGKGDLKLLPQDWPEITTLRPGWTPSHWSIEQVARTLLILSFPHDNPISYLQAIAKLFNTANLEESIALYQALPLLPHPEQFRLQAAEGVRSNMTSVFQAVALQNPYPAEYFDNIAWNQMVLKALFVGCSLDSIQGLNQRANPVLAQMLLDYARERESAKRSVPEQLWQLVETCPR
jgi:hypothetical protein